MSEVIYLSKEKLTELEAELNDLRTRGRKEIAGKIADARSHGDLSENADYDAAKNEQALMELKIANISKTLSKSQLINPNEFPDDKVYILSKVKVKNLNANKIFTYTIVSPEEADFEQNKIAVTSPMGNSMMGKSIGDIAEFKVPAGLMRLEILEISK
ncbi:MAG: transcription elongation factor GreA [Candidatus Kapaibacteriota bacterium]|jgi:transcription elongation factor GreA